MPLKNCGNGKWKWGDNGKCYNSKKDAIKQGLAIEGPDKFKKIMKSEGSKAFAGTDGLLAAKAALDEYGKNIKIEHSSSFKCIANFLSSKCDDGQDDSDKDDGDMLDDNDCEAAERVDNAGDLSGNPSNTGDGSGNEFNKKGSASTDWEVHVGPEPENFSKDEKGEIPCDPQKPPVTAKTDWEVHEGPEPENFSAKKKLKQSDAAIDGKDPNRGPVGVDNYGKNGKKDNDGDEPDPVAKGDVKDGKPVQKNIDTDDPDNNKNGLDKDNKEVSGHVVTPPYNKSASPENPPNRKTKYDPPSRNDSTAPSADNRQTLDPKIQYQVKSAESNDKMFEMEDEGDCKGNVYHDDETYEATEAVWKTIAYISQDERDKVAEEDFAGPHRSFPIRNAEDVKNAAHLVGHAANPTSVKRKIIEIARRKGLHHALPDSWKGADEQSKASVYDQALKLFGKLSAEEKEKLNAKLDFEENAVPKVSTGDSNGQV